MQIATCTKVICTLAPGYFLQISFSSKCRVRGYSRRTPPFPAIGKVKVDRKKILKVFPACHLLSQKLVYCKKITASFFFLMVFYANLVPGSDLQQNSSRGKSLP